MRTRIGYPPLLLAAILAPVAACRPPAEKLAQIPCTTDAQCPVGFHCPQGGGMCQGGEHGPIVEIIGKVKVPQEGALVEGAIAAGEIEVGYTASDFDGLKDVKLYVNGILVSPATLSDPKNATFTTTFDTRQVADGPVLISVIAEDVRVDENTRRGKITKRAIQIHVDNTPPRFTDVIIKGKNSGNSACPNCTNVVKRDAGTDAGNVTLIRFTVSENCTFVNPTCRIDLKEGDENRPTVTLNGRPATFQAVNGRIFDYSVSMAPTDSASDALGLATVVITAKDPYENVGTHQATIVVDPRSEVNAALLTHVRKHRKQTGSNWVWVDMVYGLPGAVEPFSKVDIVNAAGTAIYATTFADADGGFGRDGSGNPNLEFQSIGTNPAFVRAEDVAKNVSAPLVPLNQKVTLSFQGKRQGQMGVNRSLAFWAKGSEQEILGSNMPADPVPLWRDGLSDALTELDDAQYDLMHAFDGRELVLKQSTADDYGGARALDFRPMAFYPAGRAAIATAYDSFRDRLVVFGGIDESGDFTADTYEFDGTYWYQKTPICNKAPNDKGGPCSPPPRGHAAMAYDPLRRKAVLYSGQAGGGSATRYGDVWEWDGYRWIRVWQTTSADPGPGARAYAAATWDPDRKMVVFFGGRNSAGTLLGDLWGWGPTSSGALGWTKITEATLGNHPFREGAQIAYTKFGSNPGRLVVFGGRTTTTVAGDAWALLPNGWEQVPGNTATLIPRWGASMGFDPVRQRLVVFGGCAAMDGCTDPSGTEAEDLLFEWDGAQAEWEQYRPGNRPSARAFGGPMVYDSKRQSLLFGLGTSRGGLPADLFRHGNAGQIYEAHPRTRVGAAMAHDPVRRETILFGGDGNNASREASSDTWIWDGAEWTIVPAQPDGPQARSGASMVFLPSTGTIFMYGGCSKGYSRCTTENTDDDTDNGEVLDDLWEWDGGRRTWINRTPTPRPENWPNGRMYAMLGQDPFNRLILVGGRGRASARSGSYVFRTGFGTGTISRSGTPAVYGDFVIRIVASGGAGVGRYEVSTDGGKTFGAAQVIGNTTVAGVSLNFSGSFVAGDTYTFSTDWNRQRESSKVWLYDPDAESGEGAWSTTQFNSCETFDPARWGAPCLRQQGGIAFDPVRRRTLVVGGRLEYCTAAAGCSFPTSTNLGDVWEWDGLVWVKRTSLDTGPRFGHVLLFDHVRQKFLVVGGTGVGNGEVQSWNLGDSRWKSEGPFTSWTPNAGPVSEVRQDLAATYDPARARIIVYGGTPLAGGSEWSLLEGSTGYAPKLYMILDPSQDIPRAFMPICRTISHFQVKATFKGSGDEGRTRFDGAALYIYNYLTLAWDLLGVSGPNGTAIDAMVTAGPFAYLREDAMMLLMVPLYPSLSSDSVLAVDGVQADIAWTRQPGPTACQ